MKKLSYEIGEEAKKCFSNCARMHGNLMEEFIKSFNVALNNINPQWKKLKQNVRKEIWRQVYLTARNLCVNINDGGQNPNGMTRSQYERYSLLSKKTIIYDVPLHIAIKATTIDLIAAQQYMLSHMEDIAGNVQSKMITAYDHVVAERAKEIEAEKNRISDSPICIDYILPDPTEYESDELLLSDIIKSLNSYLQSSKIKKSLRSNNNDQSNILRRVLSEIVTFEVAEANEEEMSFA